MHVFKNQAVPGWLCTEVHKDLHMMKGYLAVRLVMCKTFRGAKAVPWTNIYLKLIWSTWVGSWIGMNWFFVHIWPTIPEGINPTTSVSKISTRSREDLDKVCVLGFWLCELEQKTLTRMKSQYGTRNKISEWQLQRTYKYSTKIVKASAEKKKHTVKVGKRGEI